MTSAHTAGLRKVLHMISRMGRSSNEGNSFSYRGSTDQIREGFWTETIYFSSVPLDLAILNLS